MSVCSLLRELKRDKTIYEIKTRTQSANLTWYFFFIVDKERWVWSEQLRNNYLHALYNLQLIQTMSLDIHLCI